MLSCQLCELFAPAQCSTNSLVLIRSNCYTIPASAKQNTESCFLIFYGCCNGMCEVRIVCRICGVSPKIFVLQTFPFEERDHIFFVFKTGVIAADCNWLGKIERR